MPALHPRFRCARRSVLASFALHLGAILVLAALLQPAGFWQKRPLELEVSIAEPVPEPELLVVTASPLPVNSGERLALQESDVFAEAGENTDYFSPDQLLPGGRNGSGAAPAPKQGSGHGASFFGTVARADYLLSRANKLETLGRWKQALAMYRRIERDYPATDAAATAAKKTLEVSASGP